MKTSIVSVLRRALCLSVLSAILLSLSGCSEPKVYGSIGVSTGFGSYGNSGMRGSISIGGRIR